MSISCNKARCSKCQTIIISRHVHDFKWCKCGSVAVDGGHDYIRRVGDLQYCEELSEWDGDEDLEPLCHADTREESNEP